MLDKSKFVGTANDSLYDTPGLNCCKAILLAHVWQKGF